GCHRPEKEPRLSQSQVTSGTPLVPARSGARVREPAVKNAGRPCKFAPARLRAMTNSPWLPECKMAVSFNLRFTRHLRKVGFQKVQQVPNFLLSSKSSNLERSPALVGSGLSKRPLTFGPSPAGGVSWVGPSLVGYRVGRGNRHNVFSSP